VRAVDPRALGEEPLRLRIVLQPLQRSVDEGLVERLADDEHLLEATGIDRQVHERAAGATEALAERGDGVRRRGRGVHGVSVVDTSDNSAGLDIVKDANGDATVEEMKATRPPVRSRRAPEEARALILGAAERLFGVRGPDAVGLKDVAREAGVSHALVSHYFGTYEGLVDAVLEQRGDQVRARVAALLAESPAGVRPARLVDKLWEALADPVSVRLTAWGLLSGRADSKDFFPTRVQGMRLIADLLEARMSDGPAGAPTASRADIEFLVTMSFVVTLGYGLSKKAVSASFGRRASAEAETEFRGRVAEMFEGYLGRRGG
jgi:AcrR family transcriptional regulator